MQDDEPFERATEIFEALENGLDIAHILEEYEYSAEPGSVVLVMKEGLVLREVSPFANRLNRYRQNGSCAMITPERGVENILCLMDHAKRSDIDGRFVALYGQNLLNLGFARVGERLELFSGWPDGYLIGSYGVSDFKVIPLEPVQKQVAGSVGPYR